MLLQTRCTATRSLSARKGAREGFSSFHGDGRQRTHLGAPRGGRQAPLIMASAHWVQAMQSKVQSAIAPTVAPALLTTALQFTPVQATLGGVVLGAAVAGKLALTGRILNISGALRGLVQGDASVWRLAFLAGMLGGAATALIWTPAAFQQLPPSFTMTRAVLGGVLVGVGTSIGNGCTSGHGISGIARLSPRSLVYTLVFMGTAAAVATVTNTAAACGVAPVARAMAMPSSAVLNQGALLVAAAALAMAGLCRVAQHVSDKQLVERLSEVASGCFFAFGLVYSGMVRPSKVAGFLSVRHPAWDPSLACVMGGALLVALPAFQLLVRQGRLRTPLCTNAYSLPKDDQGIDSKLLLGGALFGAGWGLTGLCPGPAIVSLVAPTRSAQLLAFVGAMLAGMWVEGRVMGERTPKVVLE